MEDASEGELHEPLARQATELCRKAGAARRRYQRWIAEGRKRRMPRTCRRSLAACTTAEYRAGPAGGTP